MNLNITQILTSFSFVLDYLEMDFRKTVTNHGKRVAYIAGRIGEAYNLSPLELADLHAYALMHDNGLSKSMSDQYESTESHCLHGEKNIKNFPFINRLENIILHHHERYDGQGYFKIPAADIHLFSQIIHLADMCEVMFSSGLKGDAIKKKMEEEYRCTYFSPEMLDVLYDIGDNVEFWLSMDNLFIDKTYFSKMPTVHIAKSYKDLVDLSDVFTGIIDDKSEFTASHSQGLSQKVDFMCKQYGYSYDDIYKMTISANLHDLGKLVIPNKILDKPGKLSAAEFDAIKYHTFYTRKALEGIRGFEEITEWASNHHEKLNGSGYPLGYSNERLDFNSRLMACMDIYQALTEDRPYRSGMSHTKAMAIMNTMVDEGSIDKEIVSDINRLMN